MLLFLSFLVKSDMMRAPPVADMQPTSVSDFMGPMDRLSMAV
jgi:hypothetical protein